MKDKLKNIFKGGLGQLTIPIIAILLLIIFNLIRDPSFFRITVELNNDGNKVLAGNLISIINAASELAILAMGMTLVTAASGGQDISVGAMAAIAGSAFVKVLNIKTASRETPIGSLSGGNQQKVILARWLLTHPDYLILDEPTRGIDVGTKLEIQKLVLKLAEDGVAVTFISSEIEEMLRTCSRLIVMRDRHIVGELTGSDLNQAQVMKTIAGGGSDEG